jgi:hypothetical protein
MRRIIPAVLILALAAVLIAAGCYEYKGRQQAETAAATATGGGGQASGGDMRDQIVGYWEGVEIGDWVKYLMNLSGRDVIVLYTVTEFDFEDGAVKYTREFYGNDAKEIGKDETFQDLNSAKDTYMDMKTARTEEDETKKVLEKSVVFNGKTIKGDLKVSIIGEVKADVGGYVYGYEVPNYTIEFYSKDVKVGGLVYSENNYKRERYYLDSGTAKEEERGDVYPGDLENAVALAKIPDEFKAIAKDRDKKEYKKWVPEPGSRKIDQTIPDITDEFTAMDEPLTDRIDSLEGFYKGVRPGDWCKLLVQGHHIQVWTCYAIDRDNSGEAKVSWRRRFYYVKGNLYDIQNANELVSDSEKEYQQSISGDRSYVINYDCDSITLPTGKVVSGKVMVRRASAGSTCRIQTRENKIGGNFFSMRVGKMAFLLLDYGRADNTAGKEVKDGDVVKARELQQKWLKETLTKYIPEEDLLE